MSQFYALMPDNTVKYIALSEDIQEEVKSLFVKGGQELKPDGIEEDQFDGNIVNRRGEDICYVPFELPDDFRRIPDNQADMEEYDIRNDRPKSIFYYDEGKFYFQVFTQKNRLTRKMVLTWEYGDHFSKMTQDAFVVEDKVQAIYENGKLYFQNYTVANRIFTLKDFVIEATDSDIDAFAKLQGIQMSGEAVKRIANVKTRRLIKALSATNHVETFMTMKPRKRAKLMNQYDVGGSIVGQDWVLPTDRVADLNRVLEFLNEDIFTGVITSSRYRSNSKKKDRE